MREGHISGEGIQIAPLCPGAMLKWSAEADIEVFTDEQMTAPAPNPLRADANGVIRVWSRRER